MALLLGLGVLWILDTLLEDETSENSSGEGGADPGWGYPQYDFRDDDLRSSYPYWEDAMNHRLPGSFESSSRR